MLSDRVGRGAKKGLGDLGLNAPYGARCFLTEMGILDNIDNAGLNAPYGARCFLTCSTGTKVTDIYVLMHLMALGAF